MLKKAVMVLRSEDEARQWMDEPAIGLDRRIPAKLVIYGMHSNRMFGEALGIGSPLKTEHHIMTTLTPFHIAFPVDDLQAARRFYGMVLGCPEGRSSDKWIDFNLFGHQIVAHKVEPGTGRRGGDNPVDGHEVPVPHF